MKYKLNIARDVDVDGAYTDNPSYILNLPFGFCFDDIGNHVKGYDSMADLRKDIKIGVSVCHCKECLDGLADETYRLQHPAAENA